MAYVLNAARNFFWSGMTRVDRWQAPSVHFQYLGVAGMLPPVSFRKMLHRMASCRDVTSNVKSSIGLVQTGYAMKGMFSQWAESRQCVRQFPSE